MPAMTGPRRYAAVGALVLMAVTASAAAACSSAGPAAQPSSPATAASGTGRPPAYAGQTGMMPLADCLKSRGVQLQRVAGLFGLAASPGPAQVGNTALRNAGQACTRYAGNLETIFQRLDRCVAAHGAHPAHTGSALTDLLLLNPSQPGVARAISACQQVAQNAAGG